MCTLLLLPERATKVAMLHVQLQNQMLCTCLQVTLSSRALNYLINQKHVNVQLVSHSPFIWKDETSLKRLFV